MSAILALVNLTVLLIPVGGAFFFRIYENELARQTELELISQGAVLAAAYRQEVRGLMKDGETYGVVASGPLPEKVGEYTPVTPQVDFSTMDPLPSRPAGRLAETPPDEKGLVAGRALLAIIKDARKTTLSGMQILDFNGLSVASRNEAGRDFAHVEEVAEALTGRYAAVIRERTSEREVPPLASISRGTGVRIFIAYPILEENRLWGVVYLSRTPPNILKRLYQIKHRVALIGLLLLGLTLAIAFFTSRFISRPIQDLVDKTKAAADGHLEAALVPLGAPGTEELEALSTAFSDMARSLKNRTEYLQNFAAHVSHEFKTPLTAIQGAAELLAEHADDMAPEQRRKFLDNIGKDTDRLKRLVVGLLAQARADNASPSGENVDLVSILTRLKADYPLQLEAAPPTFVGLSPETMESILVNLFDNAIRHGSSRITVEIENLEEGALVKISDNGEGVSSLNRDKIFDPFFTTRRDSGGTGLGLGIVRSLIEAHNGSIELGYAEIGTTFTLRLPDA